MKRRLPIALALLVVVVSAAFAAHGFGLVHGSGTQALLLSGNVDIRQVYLGFRVSGRINTIPYEEGAHVPAGALLAALDLRPLQAQLAADEAQVASTAAQFWTGSAMATGRKRSRRRRHA